MLRKRIRRDRVLSRAKPSASSGASVRRTWRISTVDPSRSLAGVPSIAGRGRGSTVDVVDALPRNPSGKILKRTLRAPYWEGRDRQI